MRRGKLFALMMTALLLVGCGGREEEPAVYPKWDAVQMEAELICHYGDEVRSYELSCSWSPEQSEVTVLEPAESAGITAVLTGEKLELSYGDLVLDAGSLSGGDLGPATVLPGMLRAAREGYPLEQSREKTGDTEFLRITYEVDEGKTLYNIWYTNDCIPARCEVERGGVCLFEGEILSFSGTEEGAEENGLRIEADMGRNRS